MIPLLKNYKSKNNGVSLENGETTLIQGILSQVKGNTHAEGGENVIVEPNTKIYSSKIKFPKEIVAGILDKEKSKVDLLGKE